MNGITQLILGGIFLLVVGSFGYTYATDSAQDAEKKDWRSEHQQLLQRDLSKLEQNQRDLKDDIRRESERQERQLQKIDDGLMELLKEQRKQK